MIYGPYQVYLSFADRYYVANAEHVTATYRVKEFRKLSLLCHRAAT